VATSVKAALAAGAAAVAVEVSAENVPSVQSVPSAVIARHARLPRAANHRPTASSSRAPSPPTSRVRAPSNRSCRSLLRPRPELAWPCP
jgi:hypothetical protein